MNLKKQITLLILCSLGISNSSASWTETLMNEIVPRVFIVGSMGIVSFKGYLMSQRLTKNKQNFFENYKAHMHTKRRMYSEQEAQIEYQKELIQTKFFTYAPIAAGIFLCW